MTVAELIASLQGYDPNLRVLVSGYESGYDEPQLVTQTVVDQHWGEKTVLGQYDEAYPNDDDSFDALIISR